MSTADFSTFSASSPFKEYKWFNSHSVQQELHCGVCRLDLPSSVDIHTSKVPQDLWIGAQVICHGIPLHEGVLHTSFALSDGHINALVWNTLLNFQVKIKDLSIDASIVFTAWDPSSGVGGDVYGVTTLALFDQNGRLKSGHQKLLFYPTNSIDKNQLNSKTSLFTEDFSGECNAGYLKKYANGEHYAPHSKYDQAFLMEKRLEEYERNSISTSNVYRKPTQAPINNGSGSSSSSSSCNWLDALSKARMEAILEDVLLPDVSGLSGSRGSRDVCSRRQRTKSSLIFSSEERDLHHLFCLIIELPFSPHPILHKDRRYTGISEHIPPSTLAQMMPPGCGVVVEKETDKKNLSNTSDYHNYAAQSTILEFSLIGGLTGTGNANATALGLQGGSAAFTGASLCFIADWDMDQENLAEQQYRCLAHDILRGKLDASVKPSLEDRGKIDKILNAAGTLMVFEEMDLLYRYRYFLTENKKALLKFLLSVDWTVESEVAEVPLLLAQWKKKAPLDVSDALRLLGKEKAFQSLIVRQYAVATLRSATDEELLTFLLQLVQALRYEPAIGVIAEVGENVSTLRLQDESSYNIASSFSSSFAWTRLGMSTSAAGIGITSIQNNSDRKSTPNNSSTVLGHHGAGLVSPLAQFLIDRACASPIVANFLYWYLKVETEDQEPAGLLFRQIFDSFLIQLASSTSTPSRSNLSGSDSKDGNGNNNTLNKVVDVVQGAECALQLYALNEYITAIFECHSVARAVSGRRDVKQAALRKLLKERGLEKIPCQIEGVPLPLNPKLQIISLNPSSATMFASAVYPCVIQFNCVENVPYEQPVVIVPHVDESQSLVASSSTENEGVTRLSKSLQSVDKEEKEKEKEKDNEKDKNKEKENEKDTSKGKEEDKEEAKETDIGKGKGSVTGIEAEDEEENWSLNEFDELLLQPRDVSSHPPRKIITVKLMFKSGDDLRQDQLVMQMISLMDGLLRKVNLDLKLLTYGILAIGRKDGIMEFVPEAHAISAILKEYKSITKFLRVHNPCALGPYGTHADAVDTFVKSCAASCVVSYILGVGDRHLDNIMMKTNGQIFHIDYGYCFFQDPKPVQPPPFRFTHHMLEAMGGEESEHYERFKILCCQAFNWLRKSANLILNLLSLMGDAGITDISKRSDLPKVLAKVEERFRLDLSDESAEVYFVGLINESLNAIAPRLLEYAHQIAVSVR